MPMENGPYLEGKIAYYYDELMNALTLGGYGVILQTAIQYALPKRGASVLEFACGPGANCRRFIRAGAGNYTGIDLSPDMERKFLQVCTSDRAEFLRIDITEPFDLRRWHDLVFISFAFHGFPREKQLTIAKNALRHLKPGGIFAIFDYGRFDLETANPVVRTLFKAVECPHAYNFIKLDLPKLLAEAGFSRYKEIYIFKPYLRLALARK